MSILIKNPGFLTTVQDSGREGYQEFGVTPSGVMDHRSFSIANILVGNHQNEAVLEATLMGPTIEFNTDNVIAITGGNLGAKIDGSVIPTYQAISVKQGEVLSFSGIKSGSRAYIAFAGGMDIPSVMESKSTNIKAKIGGFNGRKLEKGDVISFLTPQKFLPGMVFRSIPQKIDTDYTQELRVVMGPQDEHFTDEGILTFLSSEYTVTNEFDRMGCRLDGSPVQHKNDGNIISDGIGFGAIQIPSHGKPIIMLSDRQTTGGYTKIANVISADIPKIAQSKFGDKVKFKKISISEAHQIYNDEIVFLQELEDKIKTAAKSSINARNYNIKINGTNFVVSCEEVK